MTLAKQPLHRVLSHVQSLPYVCRSCRTQIQTVRSTTQSRGYASKDNLPLTEKIRRKIWGTDNPPGLADPYGGPSFLEKRRMRRDAARQQELSVEDPEPNHVNTQNLGPDSAQQQYEPSSNQPNSIPYVEAENWEGLEHIGHLGNWRDLPPKPQDNYLPWYNSTSKIASSRTELMSCLHQSIVECLTCKQHQIDPRNATFLDPQTVDTQIYAGAKILPSEYPSQVQFASQSEQDYLVELLTAVSTTTDNLANEQSSDDQDSSLQVQADLGTEEIQQKQIDYVDGLEMMNAEQFSSPDVSVGVTHYEVTEESFLQAKLDMHDPLVFIIFKRFSQLSGHRIPDHILQANVTGDRPLSYLLDRVYDTIKPKPKNLAEILMSNSTLVGQSNVWVLPRRETPVDKEKEVGRWKVIEKELQDRGLPVLGKLQS